MSLFIWWIMFDPMSLSFFVLFYLYVQSYWKYHFRVSHFYQFIFHLIFIIHYLYYFGFQYFIFEYILHWYFLIWYFYFRIFLTYWYWILIFILTDVSDLDIFSVRAFFPRIFLLVTTYLTATVILFCHRIRYRRIDNCINITTNDLII